MLKNSVWMTVLAASMLSPLSATAADDAALAEIRAQITQMKADYEARLQSLEQRLQEVQEKYAQASVTQQAATTPIGPAPTAQANGFNPAISLILTGNYANLSQDPGQYRLQGFIPSGGDSGPGNRGFNLGESELTLSANVDHLFSGQLTLAVAGENSIGVEESFVQTQALSNGLNLKFGRFFSGLGYQNGQHAHVWDFVDTPLAYQAFLGGQSATDGVQLKWLAPTERFLEFGLELGKSGSSGGETNKNGLGAATLFAHAGDDIGDSASWRAGLSYLRTNVADRSYDDAAQVGSDARVTNAFSGQSALWVADAIYKWSPHGNASQTYLKLQGEYLRRAENGDLAYDTSNAGGVSDGYASRQSGWYGQAVYQFQPAWRVGVRYDRLAVGTQQIGLVDGNQLTIDHFPGLAAHTPSRTSLMFDYSPSEFSRLRLQLARDHSRPEVADNQIFLQYIMSLGAHGAHAF
jgi:hypothetical protein